ncbi:MAG: DUF448 domain-containing protein [Deltaproteobacteria bacterium]|nr:DUF448 domain-containing protein [Deltaproteobacteria bacterium]
MGNDGLTILDTQMNISGGPKRRCAVSRASRPKAGLLRLCLAEDGTPFVDVLGRMPGRGVYVEAKRAALAEALTPKGLGRLFRGQARILDPEAQTQILIATTTRLNDRILELIAFGWRANQVIFGVDYVAEGLVHGEVALVFVAEDVSPRAAQEIADVISRLDEPVPLMRFATKASIGHALGRQDVGAVGIRPGTFAQRMREASDRLSGLCLRESD